MGLKEILVVLEGADPCLARLEAAVVLAAQHGAMLKGICRPASAKTDSGLMERSFREQTQRAGIPSEWIPVAAHAPGRDPVEVLIEQAFYVDLVIVGQVENGAGSAVLHDIGEQVLLRSGRPVLWVPFVGKYPSLGHRVVVAWKSGREAARAVHDALPLLKTASQVHVLTVNPRGQDEETAGRLCRYLRNHGVVAQAENLRGSLETGDLLLNRACEEGGDLMVLGAYGKGHLGPVARHLLKHMTLPVLMSH